MEVKRQVEANLPTEWGVFKMIAYSSENNDWMPQLVLISDKTNFDEVVNVRIHSECITGDLFHSKRCDCGKQLDIAMKYINENSGVLLYLRQEGRNIGIINKLKAYNLQDKGLNTAEANIKLGFPADARDFNIAIKILCDLGVKSMNLMTNNPEKLKFIEESSIQLVKRIPLIIHPQKENIEYMKTKKDYFGHYLDDTK